METIEKTIFNTSFEKKKLPIIQINSPRNINAYFLFFTNKSYKIVVIFPFIVVIPFFFLIVGNK